MSLKEATALAGSALIIAGFYLIAPALGLITAGVALIRLSYISGRE